MSKEEIEEEEDEKGEAEEIQEEKTVDTSESGGVNSAKIDKLLKQFQESAVADEDLGIGIEEGTTEETQRAGMERYFNEENRVIASMMVRSIASMTRMIARRSHMPELELTEEDQKDLTDALEPLVPDIIKYIDYIKYLPIVSFAFGYT